MSRQAAEKFIIEMVEELLPGGGNGDYYKNVVFPNLNDKQFEAWMKKLQSGEEIVQIVAPNLSKSKLTVKNNLRVAAKLGHDFWEKIWLHSGEQTYLSNYKYLIVDLPFRRQAQLLEKKISIPENNNTVDNLTGQPTGPSKGSRLSFPEIQVMAALNLTESTKEFLKYRGGDVSGFDAMNKAIDQTGYVYMSELDKLGTTVTSTETLKSFLLGMHLHTTL